jgi:hypothetical protein
MKHTKLVTIAGLALTATTLLTGCAPATLTIPTTTVTSFKQMNELGLAAQQAGQVLEMTPTAQEIGGDLSKYEGDITLTVYNDVNKSGSFEKEQDGDPVAKWIFTHENYLKILNESVASSQSEAQNAELQAVNTATTFVNDQVAAGADIADNGKTLTAVLDGKTLATLDITKISADSLKTARTTWQATAKTAGATYTITK